MSPTEQFVEVMTLLKSGELGLLRTHAGQGLDKTVDGFDLFAGLWWPLRAKSARVPRREVAWLIVKLYALRPIRQSPGKTLSSQLRRCQPPPTEKRKRKKFDEMLLSPLDKIEPALQWALDLIASRDLELDWVRLTDDLSNWDRESTRLKWAKEFLTPVGGGQSC